MIGFEQVYSIAQYGYINFEIWFTKTMNNEINASYSMRSR